MRRWYHRLCLLALGVALLCLGVIGWDEYHLRAARKALAEHDPEGAEATIDRCSGLWASRFDRALATAQAARQQEEYERAEEHLRICEELRPQADEVCLEKLRCAAGQGDTKAAADALHTSWGRDAARIVPLILALACGHLENFQVREAYDNAEEALAIKANDAEAWYYRGWALELLGQKEKALADFRRVHQATPHWRAAELRLADALYLQGYPADAAAHLERRRCDQAGNPALLLTLARCRQDLAEPDEARRILDELLAQTPHHVPALVEAGCLARRQGQVAAAEAYFRRAVARSPRCLEAQRQLHACLVAEGKREEADACLNRVQELERATARANRLAAAALTALPPRAADLRRAGSAWLDLDQAGDGLPWMFMALRADPQDRAAHARLAEYFEQAGQRARARRHAALAK